MERSVLYRLGMLVLAVALMGPAAFAATDSQTYSLTVDPVLTIAAPVTETVTVTHDATNANQAFTAQSWDVASNNSAGATLSFAATAFVHGTDVAVKRNIKLDLAENVASEDGAVWAVTTASSTSDHTTAAGATVTASSSAAGNAKFDLTATFLDTDASALPSGTYSTTVTGTLTAN